MIQKHKCEKNVKYSISVCWDYTDPSKWKLTYPNCGLNKQTPIDIVKANVVADDTLHHLQAVNYNVQRSGEYEISNNGHTLVITPMINTTGVPDPYPQMVFGRKHFSYFKLFWVALEEGRAFFTFIYLIVSFNSSWWAIGVIFTTLEIEKLQIYQVD